MRNGTRVRIIDKQLKSCGLLGTVVGTKSDGQTKIYLDEPVGKGVYLISLKSISSVELVLENDKIDRELEDYCMSTIAELRTRLNNLENLLMRNLK